MAKECIVCGDSTTDMDEVIDTCKKCTKELFIMQAMDACDLGECPSIDLIDAKEKEFSEQFEKAMQNKTAYFARTK